jgi:glycosyltransferase involved in cell wall biosynthesis
LNQPPITVIILTLNEEANLEAALDSVKGWASAVFVVDSFSVDRTVDIALARPIAENVRIVQHPFENYATQWNWALDVLPIETDWVLKLDADERVPKAFKEEFKRIACDSGRLEVAYFFRRRIYFLGQPLRWGGTGSNWDIRIWKLAYARFEERSVNEHLIVKGGPVGFMRSMIEHHDSKDLTEWLSKQNRYSSMEARIRIDGEHPSTVARLFGSKHERTNWLRSFYYKIPCRNILLFFYMAIVRFGFLDGANGIRYSYVRAMIRSWSDLKVVEHRLTGRMPSVQQARTGLPSPAVAASALQSFVSSRRESNPTAPGVDFPWHTAMGP